jgi:hypothetical protein
VRFIYGWNSERMEFAPQEFAAALTALIAPVLDAAGRAQPVWLLIALVVHSASILCRVRVWQLLLRAALPRHTVSFRAVSRLRRRERRRANARWRRGAHRPRPAHAA